jgi:putative acyl-CoA dehydrogenase
MPRLFRESPLNAIWEGSGNVIALDVLRTLHKEPAALDAYAAEIAQAAGGNAALDRAAAQELARARAGGVGEADARRLTERLALVLQGALLVRHAPPAIADAFCVTRLGGEWGLSFGTLPAGVDVSAIVARQRG